MVMHSRLSGQRGFMTAESLTSLFFYIVMVAAIAGVGAMVMSKTSGAKGAAALSIARANVIGMANLMDYDTAAKMPYSDATHKLADATGVIPGVGTMTFVAQPALAAPIVPKQVAININGITDPDVCRALGSVGFGTWAAMGMQSAAISAAGSLAAGPGSITSAGVITPGLISTKAQLEHVCANIGNVPAGAGASLIFITK